MGLFDSPANANQNNYMQQQQQNRSVSLNLNKGDVLDLSKKPSLPSLLSVGAGWDIAEVGDTYDLDLCALLIGSNGRLLSAKPNPIYYGSKGDVNGCGLQLLGDNLTGEGDGDDETIIIDLNKIGNDVAKIVFCVAIYQADKKNQAFCNVKGAFVRLFATQTNEEFCRYQISENGGNATSVIFAELNRNSSGWEMKAVGEFLRASIRELCSKYM